ncbi:hypothetical protein [Streptomyces canus]|uniref:hypothetical protein n=1 Tax=Streptomyces canus TaxID=58343 RepID=UPI00224C7EC6|nr:hypothetical protein [Streptomyces canus]MCX4859669.1 hypothetical protein [Streptomyces canus]
MRIPSRAVKALAVAALPLALAACSSSSSPTAAEAAAKTKDPNAGLLTGTQLKKALAPASYFASGFTADPSLTRDTGDTFRAPATKSATEPKCADFGATGWIDLSGIEGVSFAQTTYIDKNTSAELDQEIDVYRGTTSSGVMTALAKVAAACPSYMDSDTHTRVKITGAKTAGLGDDAYTITVTDDAWESGTTLIATRVGTAVVSVLSTDGKDDGAASAKKLTEHILTSLKGRTAPDNAG